MAYSINGIGTSICDGRGHVSWGGSDDRDSLVCFVIFYLPIFPLNAVHTFNWRGSSCEIIPIRWSSSLVLRCFLSRWLILPTGLGIILLLLALVEMDRAELPVLILLVMVSLVLVGTGVLDWWALIATDRRNCDIRRILGQHDLGSSDPATWTDDLLCQLRGPQEMHGTPTHSGAVLPALHACDYAGAMWAARLTIVRESRTEGETLTSMVLDDPGVQDALAEVRKSPQAWSRVMQRQQA